MQKIHDFLILGAGPAGLQLGYYLQKAGLDYLILERGDGPANFFRSFPRHGQLISINKVHTGTEDPLANLRWDWNSLLCDEPGLLFRNYSTKYFPARSDLIRYCEDFAAHYALNIQYGTEVRRVEKQDGRFLAHDQNGQTHTGRCLIVATGLSLAMVPDFPGVELCTTYVDHDIDTDTYKNQRVLIVGKGNSAFETADHLVESAATIHILSPEPVKMAWQTHFVGNLRAVNNNFLDTYQLKSQNAVIDANIDRVEREDGRLKVHLTYVHAMGQRAEILYDHVILCTGFQMDKSIFDESCSPEMVFNGKVPAQTPEWESSNIPSLYFAGTLMQACDYKRTMSGFIHGFRHNIATLATLLQFKHFGLAWPFESIPLDSEHLLKKIIGQVNRSPGIFLQPGFLCDVVVVDESKAVARYYTDVRKDYVASSWIAAQQHFFTISLEYGQFEGDPFSIERDPSPEMGEKAAYLHPVIRCFRSGELIAEHHINDDLESNWADRIYWEPAQAFLKEQLEPSRGSVQRPNRPSPEVSTCVVTSNTALNRSGTDNG